MQRKRDGIGTFLAACDEMAMVLSFLAPHSDTLFIKYLNKDSQFPCRNASFLTLTPRIRSCISENKDKHKWSPLLSARRHVG